MSFEKQKVNNILTNIKNVRAIAFYLPQFHPIPENDEWWGKGFTEWANVTKAKPLFRGHHQPNLPADLGFYDLRLPESRIAQAEMAQQNGVEGFCYWHYWFAGKRLLERPFKEVLKSGEPDFPFCLAWANRTWTGIWHGAPDRVLIKQEYPGMKDYELHFYTILDALTDPRYITVDNKPVFMVFYPPGLPDPNRFTDFWRELSLRAGLKGLYLIGFDSESWIPEKDGFDACCLDSFSSSRFRLERLSQTFIEKVFKAVTNINLRALYKKLFSVVTIYLYEDVIKNIFSTTEMRSDLYPCVLPNWDNTPRSGINGVVFYNSTPELFRNHLKEAINMVAHRDMEKRIVFIKSWNEWAEGNYLEPDQRLGKTYLNVLKDEVFNIT